MDPCGTPKWRPTTGDVLSAAETHWVLLVRYDFTQVTAFSLIPKENSKCFNSIGWSITSKVADKSSIINAVIDQSFIKSLSNVTVFFNGEVSVEWLLQ